MRPFTLLPTLACLILIVAHRARGFSSGAPEESCDSLTVSHIHVGKPAPGAECDATCRQARQLRWIGNTSANSFTYNCNETYQLQLTTTADVSLNGYMVASRKDTETTVHYTTLDGNVSYVGNWENGTDMKLLCNESAVTQSRALEETTTVNMTWKAPMYGLTNVAFWFVIVPSTAFYYLPVKSLTATPNPEACSCPPGQCQWLNGTELSCVDLVNSLCGPGEVFNATECQCEDCSLSIICMNGGMLNMSNCMCDCPAIYNGSRYCIRECQNNGILNNSTCSCTCAAGFSGPNCGTCSRSCQNGGTRDDGSCTCVCAESHSGDSCETCIRTCQNEGVLDVGTCTCDCAGVFSGANCETCSRSCQNGGTRDDGSCTCVCAESHSGDSCETCIRTCQNEGVLDVGTCTCDCAGVFSGANCETCSRSCQNGGTRDDGTCTCVCAESYSGDSCETCIRTCQNEGVLDVGTCTCNCTDGFSGANCETQPTAPSPPSSVVPVVVGISVGAVIIVCVIIAVIIVLVCIFRGNCCKFTSKNSGTVELRSVTTSVEKRNPAYTDVDLSEPTAEPQCKGNAAGEGSGEVIG